MPGKAAFDTNTFIYSIGGGHVKHEEARRRQERRQHGKTARPALQDPSKREFFDLFKVLAAQATAFQGNGRADVEFLGWAE
jgi:hypothetical protein